MWKLYIVLLAVHLMVVSGGKLKPFDKYTEVADEERDQVLKKRSNDRDQEDPSMFFPNKGDKIGEPSPRMGSQWSSSDDTYMDGQPSNDKPSARMGTQWSSNDDNYMDGQPSKNKPSPRMGSQWSSSDDNYMESQPSNDKKRIQNSRDQPEYQINKSNNPDPPPSQFQSNDKREPSRARLLDSGDNRPGSNNDQSDGSDEEENRGKNRLSLQSSLSASGSLSYNRHRQPGGGYNGNDMYSSGGYNGDDMYSSGGGYNGNDRYSSGGGYNGNDRYSSGGGYNGNDRYSSGGGYNGNDMYSSSGGGYHGNDMYSSSGGGYHGNDMYSSGGGYHGNDMYSSGGGHQNHGYRPGGQSYRPGYSNYPSYGRKQPYTSNVFYNYKNPGQLPSFFYWNEPDPELNHKLTWQKNFQSYIHGGSGRTEFEPHFRQRISTYEHSMPNSLKEKVHNYRHRVVREAPMKPEPKPGTTIEEDKINNSKRVKRNEYILDDNDDMWHGGWGGELSDDVIISRSNFQMMRPVGGYGTGSVVSGGWDSEELENERNPMHRPGYPSHHNGYGRPRMLKEDNKVDRPEQERYAEEEIRMYHETSEAPADDFQKAGRILIRKGEAEKEEAEEKINNSTSQIPLQRKYEAMDLLTMSTPLKDKVSSTTSQATTTTSTKTSENQTKKPRSLKMSSTPTPSATKNPRLAKSTDVHARIKLN